MRQDDTVIKQCQFIARSNRSCGNHVADSSLKIRALPRQHLKAVPEGGRKEKRYADFRGPTVWTVFMAQPHVFFAKRAGIPECIGVE